MIASFYSPEWARAMTDTELVDVFKGGNSEAFTEIFRRYRETIFFTCLRHTKSHADSEELVQETFLRAHKALLNFRGDCALGTWLTQIAINLSRNRYWYWKRRRVDRTISVDAEVVMGESSMHMGDLISDLSPSSEAEASMNEIEALVRKCVERLSPFHRDILILRTVKYLTYDEIAATLGISTGTVKSRIARARAALLLRMQQTCPDIKTETDLISFLSSRSVGGTVTRA